MRKKLHVAIVFNEPSPTSWEKEKIAIGNLGLKNNDGLNLSRGIVMAANKIEEEVRLEIETVRKSLEDFGKKVSVITVMQDLNAFLWNLQEAKPDVIFNFCESLNGDSLEEVYLTGFFELLQIPYTGSSPFVLGLAAHKNLAKDILLRHSILTPKSWFVRIGDEIPKINSDDFPLIVKPHCQDASVGIDNESVVFNQRSFEKRVEYTFDTFEESVVIERFIDGRELNVSILGNDPPEVLPISEIDFSEMPSQLRKIVSYEAKWVEGSISFGKTKPKCPAFLEPQLEKRVSDIALEVFRLLGCRDYARIDMRLDEDGVPHILEINPNPDISLDAGFVRSAKVAGLSHDTLINRIVDLALERSWQKK